MSRQDETAQSTRRQFVRAGAVVGVALQAPAALAVGPQPARSGWRRHATPFHVNPVVLPPRSQNDARQQMLWCRLMRVDGRYRIWAWTHDAPICRLFTTLNPMNGPWEEHATSVPAPPAGWDPTHFAAADVAWDPVTRRYWASPHSRRPQPEPDGRLLQLSFMLRSTDGMKWRRITDTPMIAAAPHDQALNYGRFLTDGRGRLARIGGRAWWFYRADHYDDARTVTYTLNVASSRDGIAWRPSSRNPILHGTYHEESQVGRFALGSAVLHAGRIHLIVSRQRAEESPYENVVHTSRRVDRWPHRNAGRVIWRHDLLGQPDGGSLLVERRRQLMAYSALGLDARGQPQAEGWLLRSRAVS